MFLAAIFANILAPYDPAEQDLAQIFAPSSSAHLLGTDYLGRDTLSRLIFGARSSLLVGIVAMGIAAIVGMTAGLLAGYYGGMVNAVIMRIVDALMAFPLILAGFIDRSSAWRRHKKRDDSPGRGFVARLRQINVRPGAFGKESDYILAGRSLGSSHSRLMFRHIVPNSLPPLIVLITMQIGVTILAEAGLSYLGIGITPPTPAWGAMVNDGFKYILYNPLISFVPGIAIMLVVFAFNMVGDGLRDALDPKLRGTL